MKISDLFKAVICGLCILISSSVTVALEEEPAWLQVDEKDVQTRPASGVGHEASTGFSYSGGAKLKQGNRSLGDTDSYNAYLNYTATIPVTDSVHGRLGVAFDRFGFGGQGLDPIPEVLQQTALTVGFDVELSDKWVMRFEAAPGIYSDLEDISFKDFNVPVILGFSYIVDANLQWVFGVSADFRRDFPVMPGAGVRWQFADQWTLNFIFPRPRLEYQIDPSLMLYVGGEVKGGTYAVGEKEGTRVGQPNLNNEIVEYTEARLGGGIEYKVHPAVAIHAEGGAVVYRNFSYEDDDLSIHASEPAPYFSVGVKASF
jgi:hypothetical protein